MLLCGDRNSIRGNSETFSRKGILEEILYFFYVEQKISSGCKSQICATCVNTTKIFTSFTTKEAKPINTNTNMYENKWGSRYFHTWKLHPQLGICCLEYLPTNRFNHCYLLHPAMSYHLFLVLRASRRFCKATSNFWGPGENNWYVLSIFMNVLNSLLWQNLYQLTTNPVFYHNMYLYTNFLIFTFPNIIDLYE